MPEHIQIFIPQIFSCKPPECDEREDGYIGEKKMGDDEGMTSLRMPEGFRTQIGELILE